MCFKSVFGVMVLILAPGIIVPAAMAEEDEFPVLYRSPAEFLVDQSYDEIPRAVDGVTSLEQLRIIFGVFELPRGDYGEISIERDLRRSTAIWQDMLEQQTMHDQTIRVFDLDNPYTTSIRSLPASQTGSRVVGSELVYERLP